MVVIDEKAQIAYFYLGRKTPPPLQADCGISLVMETWPSTTIFFQSHRDYEKFQVVANCLVVAKQVMQSQSKLLASKSEMSNSQIQAQLSSIVKQSVKPFDAIQCPHITIHCLPLHQYYHQLLNHQLRRYLPRSVQQTYHPKKEQKHHSSYRCC